MSARKLSFASAFPAALCLLGLTPGVGDPDPVVRETGIEVTIREGTNMAAAVSPDGATLAIDVLGRIWTLAATGGEATPLTDPFGDARQPAWSPDGERIVFQAYWGGDYDLWVIGSDGEGLARLTNGPFDDREPHWSPDGSRVVFSSDRGGTYDVWEVTVETGRVRRLIEGPDNEYSPVYGPNGDIAYVTDGADAAVWRWSSTGGATRVAELSDVDGFAPSWSPDGGSIAYSVGAYGSSTMYVAPASGDGVSTRVSADGEDVFPFRPHWLDGDRLLYTADGRVRTRPTAGGSAEEIPFSATVSLDRPTYRKRLRSFEASPPRPVRGIVSPAVSPDGEQLVFVRRLFRDLTLLRIDTLTELNLMDDARRDRAP
ncbi:MAG: TolB family protein, partial [Longimicrobiales bacterium]